MEAENKKLFVEGAKAFGIFLDETMTEAFDLFLKELVKWNRKINLTAIRTEKGILLKHFLDSLSVYPCLPNTCSLLDIGSGAGFPGIPLKIVHPNWEITLIDSVLKKVDFQRHVIRRLGLKGVEAIHGRVQDGEILQSLRERFDVCLSRAFSDLDTFLSLSYPFLKEKGMVIAMKGILANQEIQDLRQIKKNRYQLKKTFSLRLPFSSMERTIFLFKRQ